MTNDNELWIENNLVALPYSFQFTKGFLLLKLCPSLSSPFGLQEQILVPSQVPILEDSNHTLCSHPMSSHGLCNFVLGHMFVALAQVPTALIRPHLLQFTLGQRVLELSVLWPDNSQFTTPGSPPKLVTYNRLKWTQSGKLPSAQRRL